MMIDQNIDLILFVVACLIMINGAAMSLDFLERMKKRQKARRLKEQEAVDRKAGTDKNIEYIKTEKGYLLDETGEPCRFYVDKYIPRHYEIRRAQKTTQLIDETAFTGGLIFSQAMLNYYLDIPTLEPV